MANLFLNLKFNVIFCKHCIIETQVSLMFLEILDKYAPMKKKVFEGKPCYFYDQGSKKSNFD